MAIALLRLAAWFLCRTPLLTALSILRAALATAVVAVDLSPAATASRAARTAVFSSERMALLRASALRLVPIRLMLDLMFAMFYFLWRNLFFGHRPEQAKTLSVWSLMGKGHARIKGFPHPIEVLLVATCTQSAAAFADAS